MHIQPRTKASIVSIFFAIVGLIFTAAIADKMAALPGIIFYHVFIFNTFFSVQLFASLTPPESRIQMIVDGLLFLVNLYLATLLGSPSQFVFWTLILFIVATTKYAFLLGLVLHPNLLKRKILIDLSGAMLCTLSLGGIVAGYEKTSIWLFSGAFVLANIYFLLIKPMYRADF